MTQLGGFTFEDAQAIHRRVLGKSTSQKVPTGKVTVFNRAYYARLTEDLPAATDPLTGYTQAEATVLRYLAESQDTLDMEETSEPITVTNRSTNYSAQSGDVIQVDRLGSEWAPKHASGGANNSADSCPCFCVLTPSLVIGTGVNAVETVMCWKVTLPVTEFELSDGRAVLAAGTYTICWEPKTEKWLLDIGDSITVLNNAGQDVTATTTVDGQITIELLGDKTTELNICVTVTTQPNQTEVGYLAGFSYGYSNGVIDGQAGNPYDDRVIFAGATGTGAGVGQYQQFGTGTYLAPGTGTYGENTGTGTGTGTFMWSDYEEGFYVGYKDGYYAGYTDETLGSGSVPTYEDLTGEEFYPLPPEPPVGTGTGTAPGTGTYTPPGTSVPPEIP